MKQFVEETYEVGVAGEVRTDDAYAEWCNWWSANGQSGEPGNKTSFGIHLAAAFPQVKRTERRKMTLGNANKWYVYEGLRPLGNAGPITQEVEDAYEQDAIPF
jgi:hypothetical protein